MSQDNGGRINNRKRKLSLSQHTLPLCQLDAEVQCCRWRQPPGQASQPARAAQSTSRQVSEGVVTRRSILTGGQAVTMELEVVVDRAMNGEKLLGMAG